MNSFLTIACSLLVASPAAGVEILAEVETSTAAGETDVLAGEWPDDVEAISIEIDGGTLREAVEAIADEADWGLVFTAAEEVADRDVTLRLKNVGADRALEVVLKGSGLEARLDDGILVVTPPGGGDGGEVARIKVPLGDIEVDVKPGTTRKWRHHGDEERTAIGSDLIVEPGEQVDGDVVAVGGNLIVSEGAKVNGDAVAVGGSVRVKSGAHVDGQAVAVGGELTVEEGATVEGDQVSVGGSFGGLITSLAGMSRGPRLPSYLVNFLGAVVRVLALLVLGLLLISFAPERVENARAYLEHRPGHSVIAGLAILVGFIPLCILLAITVVGIPLIPVAALILAAITVIGLTAFCTWLGERIPLFKDNKSSIGALAIGLAVLFLVDLIPVIGSTAILVVAFIAAGATLLSRFGKRKPEPTVPKDVAEAI